MIHLQTDRTPELRTNVRGGEGSISFDQLFLPAELGNRADLCAILTLQPGQSIGEHAHITNGELFYIISGIASITEDGTPAELQTGDSAFCADGHTHSIANHTDAPLVVVAVIIPNR